MRNKENYHEKLDSQLEERDARIDLLAMEFKRQRADAKVDYGELIEKLRHQQATLQEKVARLKQTSGKTWVKLKNSVEKATFEHKVSLDGALLRYM
jgi:hypothetical protein